MTVKSIDLGEMDVQPMKAAKTFIPTKKNIDILGDVDVTIHARIGSTVISVDELFSLKKGDTLTLDQLVTTPVELIFNDKLIGLGELVASGEYFGIQITETK